METENLREAYIVAFQLEGVPRRLAEDCAQILINDRTRDRTPQEQKNNVVSLADSPRVRGGRYSGMMLLSMLILGSCIVFVQMLSFFCGGVV